MYPGKNWDILGASDKINFQYPGKDLIDLNIGDRVVIREGYDGAGRTGTFLGRSVGEKGYILVKFEDSAYRADVILDAFEAKPYTEDEALERATAAIEELAGVKFKNSTKAAIREAMLAFRAREFHN